MNVLNDHFCFLSCLHAFLSKIPLPRYSLFPKPEISLKTEERVFEGGRLIFFEEEVSYPCEAIANQDGVEDIHETEEDDSPYEVDEG